MMLFTSPQYQKFYTEKILKKEYKKVEKKIKVEKNEYKKEIVKKEKEIDENKEIPNNDANRLKDDKITEVFPSDTIWIENNKIIVGIKEIGAIIFSIKMKDYNYTGKNNTDKIELIEEKSSGGSQLLIGNKNYDNELFKYTGSLKKVKIREGEKIVEFVHEGDNGEKIVKKYSLDANDYVIRLKIEKKEMAGKKIGIGWKCGIKESEEQNKKRMVEKKKIHFFNGDNVEHMVMKKEGKEEPSGRYKWIGINSKYFFISINQEKNEDTDLKIQAIGDSKDKNFNYSIEMSKIADSDSEQFFIYAGPAKREELQKYGLKYEKIMFPVIGWGKIFFWSEKWFPPLADLVLRLLIGIQTIFKDWGISILILTIITKIITFPLTMSSMKSMEKMKNIQPKVTKIREKNKSNPQKMNEEIMALYKKEGVNPLNPGCLPMFLQMPIFFSLFIVLRTSIEIRGATTLLIPWISDLSQAEVLISLEKILPNGIPMYGSSIALLPILNAVLTFFSQKMTIKDPNQKAMIYFMPLFMLVIFNSFSSGLVLYWTFQSGLQLIQQLIINKKTTANAK